MLAASLTTPITYGVGIGYSFPAAAGKTFPSTIPSEPNSAGRAVLWAVKWNCQLEGWCALPRSLPKAFFPSFSPRLHSIASPTFAFQFAIQHAGLWTGSSCFRSVRHHTCRKSRRFAVRQILGRSLQPPLIFSFTNKWTSPSRLLQSYHNCF